MERLTTATPSIPTVGRVCDVDRHVSERIRRRRMLLGLTQQQLADLIGISFQQAHKYENGINRISAGRLYQIAEALGVDINYFFENAGLGDNGPAQMRELAPQQKMLLELARNFTSINNSAHQEAVCRLTRILCRGRSTT
jgi:transcriptional regulator with XRE-family HTH domain